MTKESYFELCDALGTEPIEEEIPVDYDELPLEVQEAIMLYSNLQDNWDTMNGEYLGKVLSGIKDIFEIRGIEREDMKVTLDLIGLMDQYRKELLRSKKEATKPPK